MIDKIRHTKVTLNHHPHTDSILLSYNIGSAETDHGKLQVLGSGKQIRFTLEGHDGYVTVDLTDLAGEALEMLVADYPEMTLAQELLSESGGDPAEAAANMAEALMRDDPETFKQGYSRDNAVIAAAEYLGVDRDEVENALERRDS